MNEDPNNHLMDFEEIMNTFQYNDVSQNAVYLREFPFTLKDDAKHWLRSMPHRSIRTWEEMTRKFLAKYFSSARTGKFRREIHNFYQNESETVFEAWARFKEIVRKCQHSGIEFWMKLQDFWDGLTPASRRTLSNAVEGPFMKNTPKEIVTILDELSEDANQRPSKITERRRSTGVHQVDANTSVQVKLDAMAKEIRKLILASIHNESPAACDICGRGHLTHECQASMEEVNDVGNYNFNAMGQKHPNFSWSSPGGTANAWQQNNSRFQGAPGFVNQSRLQFQPQKPIQSGLEDLMKSFIVNMDERLDAHGAAIKELGTSLRNLERQVGQIANILSERIPGTLPVDIEKNPKETINIVTLRSGKLEKEIGEIRSVPISLQLADQTTITPEGIVEDVLVWVDKFVFSVDFIVVNMEENKEVPLILGILFLAMGRAILDIHDRKLIHRVGEETMTFEMNVATGVKKERPVASVEWKVKGVKKGCID
ncbi:PREDICTED: uncharacterized protein LOC109214889 [Nicotiana attenuata]|uniref:uncharacterized protein LOC109214889 n=1 Tax=Nicotiana attenuata TaxID=49451 RepID=UPI000904BBCB|nr:PREDICTED: uncharacterized protein LOC109214889 [Nicotiana attenuata]